MCVISNTKFRYRPVSWYPGMKYTGKHTFTRKVISTGVSTTTTGSTSLAIPSKLKGSQITESEGHAYYPIKGKKRVRKGDVGGPFFTQKRFTYPPDIPSQHYEVPPRNTGGSLQSCSWDGQALPCDPSLMNFPASGTLSDSELNALGATAISRCSPNNPIVSVSTLLGELHREGVPAIVGAQTMAPRASAAKTAGSEYLNVQFGWKPLINDSLAIGKAVTDFNGVVERFEKGVGKPQRRSYSFPTTTTTTSTILVSNTFGIIPGLNSELTALGRPGVCVRESTLTREVWFKGSFTYFVPPSMRYLGKYGILAQQLGLDLNPETLWNLAPWSWAVDWFSNAGDVVSNITRFQQHGLVMNYGYLMEHTTASNSYRLIGATTRSGPLSIPDITFVTETKRRIEASPYGFGVSFDSLSGFQVSIMAALGLTKAFR